MSIGYWNGGEAAGWFSGLRVYFWGLRLHLICGVTPGVWNRARAMSRTRDRLRLTHECARMGAAKTGGPSSE